MAAWSHTLHPILKVRFEQRGPRGETVPVFRFLASDSPVEAASARLAGLEVTPGYFLSSVPLSLYVVDDVDEETAAELDLMIDVA